MKPSVVAHPGSPGSREPRQTVQVPRGCRTPRKLWGRKPRGMKTFPPKVRENFCAGVKTFAPKRCVKTLPPGCRKRCVKFWRPGCVKISPPGCVKKMTQQKCEALRQTDGQTKSLKFHDHFHTRFHDHFHACFHDHFHARFTIIFTHVFTAIFTHVSTTHPF